MDNLCHTLVGAAFGEAGLKGRTRFGSATLMIAANLPDVDVLAYATATPAVAIRRGWTHGVLAQALLPVFLTGMVIAIARWRPPRSDGAPVRPAALLLLCYVGVLSHVGLDWLNNYGVRLLMPFSGRWFYGDAIFIADPWLWVMLAAGIILSRRQRRSVPARASLAVAAAYILLMTLSAFAARQRVIEAWKATSGEPAAALMVGPVPVNPLQKAVIVDAGEYYQRGGFNWWPARVTFEPLRLPKRSRDPAVVRARADPRFRSVLVWSRFPYYESAPVDGGVRVTLIDLRFGARLGSVSVVVE